MSLNIPRSLANVGLGGSAIEGHRYIKTQDKQKIQTKKITLLSNVFWVAEFIYEVTEAIRVFVF